MVLGGKGLQAGKNSWASQGIHIVLDLCVSHVPLSNLS